MANCEKYIMSFRKEVRSGNTCFILKHYRVKGPEILQNWRLIVPVNDRSDQGAKLFYTHHCRSSIKILSSYHTKMYRSNTSTTISSSNSTLYCRYSPNRSWDFNNSTFHLIIGVVTLIAALSIILLNALVIIAIKQRKELQKLPNILLSSLAATDLLIGAIVMPLSISVDVFIFSRVSFEHVCSLLLVSRFFGPCLFSANLYHLTGYHCLGEVHGNPKMDELQTCCNKKASQKPCYGGLAHSASPVGSGTFNVGVRCGW